MIDKLMRNKAIREYLRHFREKDVDRALKATLLLGIQSVQSGHSLPEVTVELLEKTVGAWRGRALDLVCF